MRHRSALLAAALGLSSAAYAAEPTPDEAQLAVRFECETLIRLVVARSPAVRAASARARAVAADGKAESYLPPPTLGAQIWQVPLARPWAFGDAQMAMIGVEQEFPAPGARGARADALGAEARAGEALAEDRARTVAAAAEHAFADYVEVLARHTIHYQHGEVTERMLRLAKARVATGGSLAEVAQLEAELARNHVDVETDAVRTNAVRARINALLGRDPRAWLGVPDADEPSVPTWSLDAILAKARDVRPDLRAARAQRAARDHAVRAAESEATWPTFKVGASYFAPVGAMPVHGYGVSGSMSLPWLWGAATARRDAERLRVDAASSEVDAERLDVDVEVAVAEAATRTAARRFQALRELALPASRRAVDAAWSGYEAGRSDLMRVLVATRGVVDVEEQLAGARSALDHAMADLDGAVGVLLPRAPVGPLKDE